MVVFKDWSLEDHIKEVVAISLRDMEQTDDSKELESKEEYMSIDDVCNALKIHKSTLWRWRKQGLIPFMQYGRTIRFKASDINFFINQNYIRNEGI